MCWRRYMNSLTIKIKNCSNNYIYKQIFDYVIGEGGDGWAYIVCDDAQMRAEQFLKYCKKNSSFSSSMKLSGNVEYGFTVNDDISQEESWVFVDSKTQFQKKYWHTEDITQFYDFIFYINREDMLE